MRVIAVVAVWAFGTGCAMAQSAAPIVPTPGRAPEVLPGKGLAQHDFVYSGESHDRKIFIVRGGRWCGVMKTRRARARSATW
jgi:hypothetical protein